MSEAAKQAKVRAGAELHLVNETRCAAHRTFLKFTFTLCIITGEKVKVQPVLKQNNNEKKF